jgi:hypothetical protein
MTGELAALPADLAAPGNAISDITPSDRISHWPAQACPASAIRRNGTAVAGVTRGMTNSSRLLRGVVSAGLLMLAAGCVSVSGTPRVSGTPLVPTGESPAAMAVRHPGGPLPGLRYLYGGTATLTAASPPASSALPGANDVLVAAGAAGAAERPASRHGR